MELSDIKYNVDYKWLRTKDLNDKKVYDLYSPAGRKEYFEAKIGKELELLRKFLSKNTFIAYFLAPKMAGKGTYTAMLKEAVGGDFLEHVSVGDLVRDAHEEYLKSGKDSDIYKYALKNYRGVMHVDEAFEAMVNRTQKSLMPTDIILTIIKRKIDTIGRKTIFLDGFPRDLDQVAFSLYFRDLINYRNDPDCFIFINLPVAIIDARIKGRRVCPVCKTSRNEILNPTSAQVYDEEKKKVVLLCDNPECSAHKMVEKEGDEKGIGLIADRVVTDIQVMEMARKMYGLPKIEIFNSLEVDKALDYADEYEFTVEHVFDYVDGEVKHTTKPFTVTENGKEYYSLVPAPVFVSMVKQLCDVFGLK